MSHKEKKAKHGHSGHGGHKSHSHPSYHSPHPWEESTWTQLALLLFAVLSVLYVWGNNRYELFDVDEAIFTQATVEMVESNNYVMPTYNSEPRYHKPPLIYWLQSASLELFHAVPYNPDITPFAARLPSALCGLLAVIIFYLFSAALTGQRRFGLVASGVLGLSLLWLIVVRAAIADAALNLIMLTSTMYALWLLYKEKICFWHQIGLGLLLALGVLAKGPVALVVPGGIVGFAVLVRPGFWRNLRILNPVVILLALMVGVMPWFVMIIQSSGLDFFKEFIWVHNVQRFFGGLHNSHTTSPLYYPLVFLVGFFPWSILFLVALPWAFLIEFVSRLRSTNAKVSLPLLGMFWCVFVIILFSFSKTKLVHYIVPALPGAALFIAGWLDQVGMRPKRKWLLRLGMPVAVLLAVFFFIFNRLLRSAQEGVSDPFVTVLRKYLGLEWPPHDPLVADILMQHVQLNWAPVFMAVVLVVGSYAGFKVLIKGFRHGLLPLMAMQLCFLTLVIVGIMPVVSDYIQRPLTELGHILKEKSQHSTVYHLGLHHPSVRLISGVPFVSLSKPVQLDGLLADKRTVIFHEAHKLPEILLYMPENATETHVCRGGYCVLELDARPLEMRHD